MDARSFLCIALDVDTRKDALRLVRLLKDFSSRFKVGLQLFSSVGPSIIEKLCESGVSVFVDLKLNDIPNTVKGAVSALSNHGASLITVHSLAGKEVIRMAKETALKFSPPPSIIAVTLLTSLDRKALAEMGIEKEPNDFVVSLAEAAVEAGADGVVASAQETGLLRRILPRNTLIITPGIRLAHTIDDQKRVTTPQSAIKAGADILVVGRPIIEAENPRFAAKQFISEIEIGIGEKEG
jgi:orotidine-5'-phosphate decarboxylase